MSIWRFILGGTWGGNPKPSPFTPAPGVFPAPVETPPGAPFRPNRRQDKPVKRKSPGDPGCPDCRAATGGMYVAVSTEARKTFAMAGQRPAGACDRHQNYHHPTNPFLGLGFSDD